MTDTKHDAGPERQLKATRREQQQSSKAADTMPNHDTATTADDDPSRAGIRFDRTINLGHVLTFIGFILTGLLAWSTMDKRVTVLEEARKVQELRDIAQDGRLSEKMGEIRDSLTDLKRGVEQVRDRLEKRP